DEYLLGRDILVAPVVEKGSTKRSVYLPEDEWIHVFTKTLYPGGSYEIDAPIGYPPVFVRASSPVKDRILNSVDI
ncbi:MAG: hypothetical protein J5528_05810, partial [Firmicutes bacterium]|nr:hypothetical protein [Bacillota bacterium]